MTFIGIYCPVAKQKAGKKTGRRVIEGRKSIR